MYCRKFAVVQCFWPRTLRCTLSTTPIYRLPLLILFDSKSKYDNISLFACFKISKNKDSMEITKNRTVLFDKCISVWSVDVARGRSYSQIQLCVKLKMECIFLEFQVFYPQFKCFRYVHTKVKTRHFRDQMSHCHTLTISCILSNIETEGITCTFYLFYFSACLISY